ncbi:MAG: exodeoxyribonuclease VII small subunit [Acidimicrobiia bacterium]
MTDVTEAANDDTTIGYAEAMDELGDILDELERDDLDVDVLAERVRRASFLIKLCRGRIARARADVEGIVTDLEAFAAAEGDADDA